MSGKIGAARQTQREPLSGRRADRDQQIAGLIDAALRIAGPAHSYALAQRRVDLLPHLKLTRSDFRLVWISEQPLLAQRVHNATLRIVGELEPYGIVAAALAAFRAQIAAVRATIDAWRSGMATRVASRGELMRLFRAGDRLMREFDGVMFPLRAPNAELHDQYLATRQVLGRRGARSTGEGETPPGELPVALSAAAASAPPHAISA